MDTAIFMCLTSGSDKVNQLKSARPRTNRLELTAAALQHIRTEMESPENPESLPGSRAEPGWPPGEYDRGAQEFFRHRLKEKR